MAIPKKEIEVLFRSYFQVENTTEGGMKTFLENSIPRLQIKSIEIFSTKSHPKALASSNVTALLVNQEVYNATGLSITRRKSFGSSTPSPFAYLKIWMGSSFLKGPTGSSIGKDKEISELGSQLSKLRKELSDIRAKSKVTEEGLEQAINILQEQITMLSR